MYQPQDFFFKKAKKEGYPARSVYKLQEINQRFHIFHRNDTVLDLGCAPGSWLKYAEQQILPRGLIIGIDLKPITIETKGVFIQKDIFQLSPQELENILQQHKRQKINVIISDMAPATSGVKELDENRSLDLIKRAFDFVSPLLEKNGFFVCKAFESYEVHLFVKRIAPYFQRFKIFKPRASRKHSKELYLIGSRWLSSIR